MQRGIKSNIMILLTVWLLALMALRADVTARPEITIRHGVTLPDGRTGFRLEVTGWPRFEPVEIWAISPRGEQLNLTKGRLATGDYDSFTITIGYDNPRFSPGHWVLILASKRAGGHVLQLEIP